MRDQQSNQLLLTASQNDPERTVWNMNQNTVTTPNKLKLPLTGQHSGVTSD